MYSRQLTVEAMFHIEDGNLQELPIMDIDQLIKLCERQNWYLADIYTTFSDFPMYGVNPLGTVMNLSRMRPMRKQLTYNGYYRVIIRSIWKTYVHLRVPVMVASAYCGRPSYGLEVDHIDRNRRNDHYTNLRWITHKDNLSNR